MKFAYMPQHAKPFRMLEAGMYPGWVMKEASQNSLKVSVLI